jgi:hypothetical protein
VAKSTAAAAASPSSGGPAAIGFAHDNDDDNRVRQTRSKTTASRKQWLLDYLFFRRMISPILVQIFFFVGTALCLIGGFLGFIGGLFFVITARRNDDSDVGIIISLVGFLVMIFGPFVIRIFCENLILLFRINETLTDIRNQRL